MFINEEYEKQLIENLRERAEILMKSEKDTILQSYLKKKCEDDIVFFFRYFLYTMKNDVFFSKSMPRDIPFVPFEYQEKLIRKIWDDINNWRNLFIEKSRQMWITWLLMWVYLYWFIFHSQRYHIISQKEELVDKAWDMRSCFEKLRYFARLLPKRMLPEWFSPESWTQRNKYMGMSTKDNASITWESANPNAWTWWTYNSIFLDEMSKMSNATQINTACAAASPCTIYNSTPLWEWNEYYRMRKKAMEAKIDWVRLHRSLHPLYTKEWYEWKTAGMQPEAIAQELEISYNASVEWAVYKRFHPKPEWDVEFGEFKYDYNLPLYVSIDNSHWWKDNHAIIVAQTTHEGKIRIIDSIQLPSYTNVTECASYLAKQPIQSLQMNDTMYRFFNKFKTYKPAIFIWDPYDTHTNMINTTISKEYAKFWISLATPVVLMWPNWNVAEQIRITQNNLHRLQVDEWNTDFISSIQNARYPEKREWSQSTSTNYKPIHDWTSHFRTSLEYLVLFITEIEENRPKKKRAQRYEIWDPITWWVKVIYK